MRIQSNHIYHFVLLFFAIIGIEAAGQNTHIEYGEDTVTNISKYDRIYQVISAQKINVNTLIKFDAVQWGQIHPSITVEQRLWKDLTIEPNITMSSLEWSRDEGYDFAINPNLDLKYYFNRSRRERLGKNVIGFSADYILVGFSYTYTDDKSFYNYELEDSYIELENGTASITDSYMHIASWHVMCGMQRKIGNMAYADVAIGCEKNYFGSYGTSKVIPTIKIKLGFALSPEQIKRICR